MTKSDFNRIKHIANRLREIFKRDSKWSIVPREFEGNEDYIARCAIEALGLSESFYDSETKE